MKRVIISGATGAVGIALIKKMIEHDIEVLVLCRKNSERNRNIPKHPLVSQIECSLENLKDLKNETEKKYDVFYHFAWQGTVGSARNDMYLQNQNVAYALDAVGVAKRFGCDLFIGAGSQAEYGRVEGVLKPKTPTFPEMGYGMGKLCAGLMTREYAQQLNMKHVWVRILSVYGPHDGENSMVMSTIKKLQEGLIPEFTKGEQLWDYLYSEDAANAFYLLGNSDINGKTYVLGSGQAVPLYKYIDIIHNEVEPDSKIKLGVIPYGEKQVMHLQADISELEKDVGFEPQIDFKDGIHKILISGKEK